MRKSTIRTFALAASALTSFLTDPAFAQNAQESDSSSGAGGDIIVTARRIEEKLQDVPISITVYNQEQLTDRNVTSSAELAAYTPSLSLNSRYGPEKASFAIRGFSQDLNTLPSVAVYFADVVAPRLSSNLTSGNGAGPGSMFDLQNVQVLKGPQGTLFGRNTTGGAILLVPRKPTDKLEGYVEGTLGNFAAKRVEAVINIPLSDSIQIRAGIDRNKRDGYIKNRSGIGPADFNDVDYFAARLGILAQLSANIENYTLFTYSRSDTNGTLGKIAYCNRGTVVGSTGRLVPIRADQCAQFDREAVANFGYYDVENSNPLAFVKGRQWQASNTTTWKASDTLTVKNIISYGEAKESYSLNISGDNVPTPFVTTYPGPDGQGQGNQWTFTEELQLQGNTSNDKLTWQAGGYMELSSPIAGQQQYTSVYSNCTNIYAFQCAPLFLGGAPFSNSSVGVARNDYYYRNYGLYAQATYKLTERLSVTAGIRNTWDWEKETADNTRVSTLATGATLFRCSRAVTPTPNPGAALLTSGACGIGRTFIQKSQKPTWLVDVDFKPTEDLLIFAKYARGYRGGGINEANLLAETWKPEKVDNYEIGIKGSFNGSIRGNFSLVGFWNDFTDQQTSVLIPACLPITVAGGRATCTTPAFTGINGIQNVGKSRLKGVEADGSILLGDSFRFDFGYAYLDAKVVGGSVPFCDNASFECANANFLGAGSPLPFAPKNRITLTGTYTLPLGENIGKISIGATFTHTDEQRSGTGNDLAFAQGAIPFNASITPPTDLLNLNLNWKGVGGSPVDLALFATNVTNQKYFVTAANALSSTGADFVQVGAPRMFGARLKFSFGN